MEQNNGAGGEEIGQSGGPERRLLEIANEQLIYLGITDALQEDRAIDHATARFIAEQAGGARGSALRVLASTGEIARGLAAELEAWRARTPVELEPWGDALDEYTRVRSAADRAVAFSVAVGLGQAAAIRTDRQGERNGLVRTVPARRPGGRVHLHGG